MKLTSREQGILARSYDPAFTKRRQRMVLAWGVAAFVTLVVVAVAVEDRILVGVTVGAYVAITAAEKWAFGNGVLLYKSVIRKLDTRRKELEAHA